AAICFILPLILSTIALGGCSMHEATAQAADNGPAAAKYPVQLPFSRNRHDAPRTPAQKDLEAAIDRLGGEFKGSVGIAVIDLESGWTTGFNAGQLMPQQSVSKLWVAITALDRVDRAKL